MKYIELLSTITTNNKYYTWYVNICQMAKSRNLQKNCGVYIEKHHVVPKSFNLGGQSDSENIVNLTAREHYIAHLLLSKMFDNKLYKNKMHYALWRLSTRGIHFIPNSHSYQTARQQILETIKTRIDSEETRSKKSRPGHLNSMYGKKRPEIMAKANAASVLNSKGKTYEMIYGKIRAAQLKSDRSKKLKSYLQQNSNVRQGTTNPNAKTYCFVDPDGIEHIVTGQLKVFCKTKNLDTGTVINCIKGRRESYKGWVIRYL